MLLLNGEPLLILKLPFSHQAFQCWPSWGGAVSLRLSIVSNALIFLIPKWFNSSFSKSTKFEWLSFSSTARFT